MRISGSIIAAVVALGAGLWPARGAGEIAAGQGQIIYFISDLHIGGDGALNTCGFEKELIEFLKEIEAGRLPAELIIVGDTFGLWEITEITGNLKLPWLVETHPNLFRQFRETGERVTITLLVGNHDYDLACIPAYRDLLAKYNLRLDTAEHTVRRLGKKTIWIEHGNQHDSFNRFPDYGNLYGLPSGYFITTSTVAVAGRSALQARSMWLKDLPAVYPSEEIPSWIWSNYFYKEMTPILRWFLLPFMLLFGFSAIMLAGRRLEEYGVLRTQVFRKSLRDRFGLPGRLIDLVVWVNGIVLAFLVVLAIPVLFLTRDIHSTLRKYGIETAEGLKADKEGEYLAAAEKVFAEDPAAALFIYGHTHSVSLRHVKGGTVVNTGTWLKRLERVRARFLLMPPIYVPSYNLNYFTAEPHGDGIRLRYRVIPKDPPRDLTLLERLVILGRARPAAPEIPEETILE
ncbi:MAG: metallophosphoesterase [bacterium]|nr:metallophosphoesterase [bacterium]